MFLKHIGILAVPVDTRHSDFEAFVVIDEALLPFARDAAAFTVAAEDVAGATTTVGALLSMATGTNGNRATANASSSATCVCTGACSYSISDVQRGPTALRRNAAPMGQKADESQQNGYLLHLKIFLTESELRYMVFIEISVENSNAYRRVL